MKNWLLKIFNNKTDHIYADYASTTPMLPEVFEAMMPFWQTEFYNPAAIYERGVLAKEKLEQYRLAISRMLGSRAEEIIFTGSGTESDNLVILGVLEAAWQAGIKKPQLIATSIEHPAVLEALAEAKRRGALVTKLPVNADGLVNLTDLKMALTPETILVTVMYANNEIGVIEPIKAVSRIVREYRREHHTFYPYLHTDASQAANYLNLNVNSLGVDFLTLDGSKIYGPKGVGLLYKKHLVKILPLLFGGGQERGLRPGTENLALIAGLTTALTIAVRDQDQESKRLKPLRDKIIKSLLANFPNMTLNGSLTERLPNNINVCLPGIDAEFAVIKLDLAGIECSFATACQTYKDQATSYVIEALGKKNCVNSSLRLTLGRQTSPRDCQKIIERVRQVLNQLTTKK